jgi:glucokinase
MCEQSQAMTATMQKQTGNSKAAEQGLSEVSGSGYVVGVDIGGTNLRLALADMAGTIGARWSTTTAGSRSADAVVDLICSGVEDLLQQASVPRSALKAIAAGAPGITDVDAGVVIATSYLLGWQDVPLRDLLESALGIPALVDNDVNLAALGEGWAGAAKGTGDFVFIAIGTGLGAGIILDGRPFRGMGWSAGEIGYMLVPGVSDEPVGHGEPGALESIIGGEGIKAQWQGLWHANSTALPRDVTATEIFDGALKGDPLAQSVLRRSARMLADAIYNISLVLNCPLFVLGGGVGMHPVLGDATQEVLDKWNPRVPVRLQHSVLGADAQLIGAIRLALDAANSPFILSANDKMTNS